MDAARILRHGSPLSHPQSYFFDDGEAFGPQLNPIIETCPTPADWREEWAIDCHVYL